MASDSPGSSEQKGDGQGTLHVPVLLREALEALELAPGQVVVDGTVGAGGHGREMLEAISPGGELVGLDRDPEILVRAKAVLEGANKGRARFSLHPVSFTWTKKVLEELGHETCDRLLLDLGVSSMQIDIPERGFSFLLDGPLDMRMNRTSGPTLDRYLDRVSEEELARVIHEYGEERHARRVARAILFARRKGQLHGTLQLAEVVLRAVVGRVAGRPGRPRSRIHPATRTFQALRIAVNDEIKELQRGLEVALSCLAEGGRLVVIAFHSLEDRIVKRFLRANMELPFKKPIRPTAAECERNPRARSARLRCGIKRAA
ncbi:MAG: 16S rRNA (cytosine(1402)-N(4))-methyltransferase RsmH [Planctomycetota bacterium]|jgi:16S rRNA (cytosine1402-N4)-methyltransferase